MRSSCRSSTLIFQAAMGWEDYHLHYFEIDGQRYGMPDPEWDNDDIDEETVTFSDLVSAPSPVLL